MGNIDILRKSRFLILTVCVLVAFSCAPRYDLVIQNGTVVDGSGRDGFRADVAVRGERIAKLRQRIRGRAVRRVDATGMIVAPGFIDVHAHLEPLPLLPEAESCIRQGVTTAIGGPDGSSPLCLAPYLDSLRKMGIGINAGYLIGHNTIRLDVIGMENRPPTPAELEVMKAFVEAAMKDGVFGLSTGLKYLHGAFARTEEVVALSQVAAAYGGVYTSHIRELSATK